VVDACTGKPLGATPMHLVMPE